MTSVTKCLNTVTGITAEDRRAVLARVVELRKTMPQQQAAAQAVREAIAGLPQAEKPEAIRAVLLANNASGESAASLEAQARARREKAARQTRVLVDKDGTARVISGVDAVDQRVKPGQVLLQRGIGRDEWTVLDKGEGANAGAVARAVIAAKKAGEFEQDQKRGSYSPKKRLIKLLDNANLSTFLHESGHFYLDALTQMAAEITKRESQLGEKLTAGEKEIVADVNIALKDMGIVGSETQSAIDQWSLMSTAEQEASHEKWARGFEKYLMEGKAPSIELQALFGRFRAWLVNIYKTLRGLDVKLNDEVRGVFDRMLASSEAIEHAKTVREMGALFTEQTKSGMTPEQWTEYQKLGEAQTQAAEHELDTRLMGDMKWMRKTHRKAMAEEQRRVAGLRLEVEREVRAEVMKQPVYQVWQFLTGKGDSEIPSGKLDATTVEEISPGTYDELKARGWLSKIGTLPEMIAKQYGMGNAQEMLYTLASAPHPNDVIQAITDREMMDRYGEITTPEALALAADEAVHNELSTRILAAEMNALEKATKPGRPNVVAQAARQYAEESISQVRIRDLNPSKYAAAEARAGREAAKAFKAGKIAEAAKAKRTQVINNAAAREALMAQKEVDKGVKYLKRMLAKPPGVELDYWQHIAALLEAYELGTVTGKAFDRAESLVDWVAAQEALGRDSGVDPALLEMAKSYKALTVEEFRGLVDSVKSIEHLGRLKRRLMLSNKEATFEATRDAIVKRLEPMKGGHEHDTANTYRELLRRGIGRFAAEHRKFASLALEADGFDYSGPMQAALVHSMNKAGAKEAGMRNAATKRLWEILKPAMKVGGITRHSQTFSFGTLNQEQRMAILLNWGNAGNKQRLLDGREMTEPQAMEVINSMSKAELDAAQGVWDFFESYKPEVQRLEKETYNREPKWIEPLSFETKHGVYRGGYFPAVYDPQVSDRTEQLDTQEEAKRLMSGAGISASTRRGYVKARSEKVKRPILLTLDGLWRGTNEVIHDLSWREWVMDANSMLRDKEVSAQIRDKMGPEKLKAMRETVRDIAAMRDVATTQTERVSRHIRSGAVIAALGLNLSYAMVNLSGFSQSAVRIGPANVLKGLGKWLSSPVGAVTEMHEKSEQMRTRALTLNREVNEVRSAALGRSAARTGLDKLMFFPAVATQLAVDTPTWWGAYNKAQDQGLDEAKSVAMADQAVLDSQSGGQIKDLAGIQRTGEFGKLLTVFYGYFNATWNMSVERTKATDFTSPAQVAKLARDYLLLYTIPSLIVVAVREALSGGDDDEFWGKVMAENLSAVFGTLVGVREVSASVKYLAEKAAGNDSAKAFGYSGPAGLRFLSELDRLAMQVAQGDADRAAVKTATNVAGIALHLPSTQINRSIDGFIAYHEGETDNPLALILGKPKN